MTDRWILAAALVFIALLGGLTIAVTIEHGPDVLTVGSLLVLAMFGFGILGALRNPPDK
jgi:hypothetical protein